LAAKLENNETLESEEGENPSIFSVEQQKEILKLY
jgi:hypothetical protein